MKENIEEDLKKTENLIECFRKAEIVNLECKESMYQRCNYSHYKAIEHILSDYKRVLKENEELKEERDAIYSDYQDLGKEKWEADEAILFLTERLENSISKQKIKDKIEELNKKEKQELKGTKGQDRYSIKQQYMYQRNVLQDLLEEKGE